MIFANAGSNSAIRFARAIDRTPENVNFAPESS
jgi:hypothetical protein